MGKSYRKIIEDKEYIEIKNLSSGIIIFTVPGKKGPKDFRVRSFNPKTGLGLQPKHAHFAIDFYGKLCANKEKALKIFEAIKELWNRKPIEEIINRYRNEVEGLPGYDLEYILYTLKWILEQEDVNFKGRSKEKQVELDKICKSQNVITPEGRKGSQLAIALFCDILNGTHPVEAFIKSGLRI
ncbi:MAG: hypothetical protein QXL09_03110 [Candidatus Aenigmatarchaeota archaeon]